MVEVISEFEARVLGVMLEKEVTTPEVYPMTVNAIMTGCNQKSNREPVLSMSTADVINSLDLLQQRHWVLKLPGARSVKYKQRFCNTEFSAFQFSAQERAVLCLLLLRGPQTPGELRSRCARMADFTDVKAMEACLHGLEHREKGALVVSLDREPGRRELRYAVTFVPDERALSKPTHAVPSFEKGDDRDTILERDPTLQDSILARLEALESRMSQLEELVLQG